MFINPEPKVLVPHAIPPDDDESSSSATVSEENKEDKGEVLSLVPVDTQVDGINTKATYGLQDLPTIIKDADKIKQMEVINAEHNIIADDELKLKNPSHELLRQHYKLNHLSFHKLQQMAKQGDLPKRLATCPQP